MGKSAYLNTRVDPSLKAEAEKIFDGIGVTFSQGITMFLRQVVLRKGIPFDVCIPNDATLSAFQEIEAGGGEVFHGPTEEFFDQILSDGKTRRG